MYVCPSVRIGQPWSQQMDFHDILYLIIFRKYVVKIQVSLTSEKNYDYFTWLLVNIFHHISLSSSQKEKRLRRVCRENQNTPFSCARTIFENRAVYEITWKNFAKRATPQMKIWRVRIACWKPTATNSLSKRVISTDFQIATTVQERVSMLRYTYTASLV